MAKLIREGQIHDHEAGALLVSSFDDFDENQQQELITRYGKDGNGVPILKAYEDWLKTTEDWGIGRLGLANFGTDEDPKWVVFICITDEDGLCRYPHIRKAMLELKEKAEKLPVSYFACGVLGRAHGDILAVALDLVLTAALGKEIAVDIYDVTLQPQA